MRVVVGIPARMGSTRFFGKPLARILDMPMIEHVYKRCRLAQHVDDLLWRPAMTKFATLFWGLTVRST
jgi:CMP-2-keto-3-deoxyoctulosonic acid synthetase